MTDQIVCPETPFPLPQALILLGQLKSSERTEMHFVSAACKGERCTMCVDDATHKVGEEILFDDPNVGTGHNLTAYVCCYHFGMLMRTVCKEE
jgi:hypothetical protein